MLHWRGFLRGREESTTLAGQVGGEPTQGPLEQLPAPFPFPL